MPFCSPLIVFNDIYKAFVRGFCKPIPLGVVRGRVNQCDSKLFTELNQWFNLESWNIISDNSVRTPKPCHNVLKETNDHFVGIIPCRDSFYPLSKVICSSQDLSMLTTRSGMNFLNKI
jgi:hypothetical protein